MHSRKPPTERRSTQRGATDTATLTSIATLTGTARLLYTTPRCSVTQYAALRRLPGTARTLKHHARARCNTGRNKEQKGPLGSPDQNAQSARCNTGRNKEQEEPTGHAQSQTTYRKTINAARRNRHCNSNINCDADRYCTPTAHYSAALRTLLDTARALKHHARGDHDITRPAEGYDAQRACGVNLPQEQRRDTHKTETRVSTQTVPKCAECSHPIAVTSSLSLARGT